MAEDYPYQAGGLDDFSSYDYDISNAVNKPFDAQNSPRDIFSNATFYDFDYNAGAGAAMENTTNMGFASSEYAMAQDVDANNIFNMMPAADLDTNIPNNHNMPALYNNSNSNTSANITPTSPTSTSGTSPSRPRKRTSSASINLNPSSTNTTAAANALKKSKPSPAEDPSKVSAEEDKRRRNTAASARFRIKKKEREKATEQKARDLEDRIAQIEREYKELEKENRLLKGLLTEKNGANWDVKKEME